MKHKYMEVTQMEAAAIVQNKNKCALVSWHPSICSTTQTNGIFPDFLVILIGIRAEDGENLVFAFLTFRLYFSLYNHPFLEILFLIVKKGCLLITLSPHSHPLQTSFVDLQTKNSRLTFTRSLLGLCELQ